MAEITVGKFEWVEGPDLTNLRWRSQLSDRPSEEWEQVFRAEMAAENTIGNGPPAGHVRIEGALIEFAAPEDASNAWASTLRRVIAKTNQRAAKLQSDRQRDSEVVRARDDAERERLRKKFREGL